MIELLRVFLIFAVSSQAFKFDLGAQTSRCYVEELPTGFTMRVKYDIAQAYGQEVDFKISTPDGVVFHQELSTNKGAYDIATNQIGGDYSFCFVNKMTAGLKAVAGMKRVVDLDFVYASDMRLHDSALKKGHLRGHESKLRLSLDLANQLQLEYQYMKDREAAMRDTTESTNARTMWTRMVMLGVALTVGYIQVTTLRKYFQRRKFVD